MLNPEAVFLRCVTEAFLLFLAPAGGPNPVGHSLIEIEIFILLHNQAVTFILYKKNYKIGTAHPA